MPATRRAPRDRRPGRPGRGGPAAQRRAPAGSRTKVITDLLIFRRREPGRGPDPAAWEQTRVAELDGVRVPVNEYFLANPGAVLGQMARHPRRLQREDLIVARQETPPRPWPAP